MQVNELSALPMLKLPAVALPPPLVVSRDKLSVRNPSLTRLAGPMNPGRAVLFSAKPVPFRPRDSGNSPTHRHRERTFENGDGIFSHERERRKTDYPFDREPTDEALSVASSTRGFPGRGQQPLLNPMLGGNPAEVGLCENAVHRSLKLCIPPDTGQGATTFAYRLNLRSLAHAPPLCWRNANRYLSNVPIFL